MATEKIYICECGYSQPTNLLVDVLNEKAMDLMHLCPHCKKNMDIELTFKFGLGAGENKCKVLHVFKPKDIESWVNPESDLTIEFHPFLVILEEYENKDISIWLPYWHYEDEDPKYGQWAPFMHLETFRSLLEQAKLAGYIFN